MLYSFQVCGYTSLLYMQDVSFGTKFSLTGYHVVGLKSSSCTTAVCVAMPHLLQYAKLACCLATGSAGSAYFHCTLLSSVQITQA